MPTLHIGRKRVQTLSASDGSSIPPGVVSAVSQSPVSLSAVVNPTTNEVTVTGLVAGNFTVTYSATGYQPVTQSFQISPLPNLIVTDGPEVPA